MNEGKQGIFTLMVIELLIIAFSVGTAYHSLLIGILTFIGVGVLYFIPIIGQALGTVASLFEAYILFELLTMVGLFNTIERVFFCTITSLILIYLHNRTVEVEDLRLVGFGWLLFESFLVSSYVHYFKHSFGLSCIILLVILILAVVPWLRVVEFLALSIFSGYFAYSIFISIIDSKYAFWASLIIFIYSVAMYAYVYKSLDYIGMKKRKAEQEERNRVEQEFQQLLLKIYEQYPELEKTYYYYKMTVCISEEEKQEFDIDWMKYIFYLGNHSLCDFNSFFEKEKMFRYRFYNRDYAENNCHSSNEQQDRESKNKHNDQNVAQEDSDIIYFKGINSMEGLKKRYRELMKIYHTDNLNGDTGACQIIQNEYELLLKKYR